MKWSLPWRSRWNTALFGSDSQAAFDELSSPGRVGINAVMERSALKYPACVFHHRVGNIVRPMGVQSERGTAKSRREKSLSDETL